MRPVSTVAAGLLVTLVTLASGLSAAEGGTPIARLSPCANSYLLFGEKTSKTEFRAAVVCLINAARKAQHLPALRRAAPLESVAQAQSDKFAKTGSASHGKSLAEIGKRFERKGYRTAAYDEAFSLLDPGASPYAFVAEMLGRKGLPCSQILDPRFRDVGVGVSTATIGPGIPSVTTLAVELGLRRGSKQPSNDFKRAASCPHKVPAPIVTGAALVPGNAPTASGDTVTAGLKCVAKADCVFSGTMTLVSTGTRKAAGPITIPAGQSLNVAVTFDAGAVQAELASGKAAIRFEIKVTEPAQYDDVFSGPLTA
jgi:uncharacterized protein YkwD